VDAPLSWENQLREIGFEEVHIEMRDWGLGRIEKTHGKESKDRELRILALANFLDLTHATQKIFTAGLGWNMDSVHILVAEVADEPAKSTQKDRIRFDWPS
jgi:hypothetical protein